MSSRLNYQYMYNHHLPLLAAAQYYFSGWKRAVEEAGIDYSKVRKAAPAEAWTRSSVRQEILRRWRGRESLSHDDIAREFGGLMSGARRHFGSWRKAIEACGLVYADISRRTPPGSWSVPAIIAEIRSRKRLRLPLNVAAVLRDNRKLVKAAELHIGSWRATLEQAGIRYGDVRRYREWSQREVLKRLRRRIEQGIAVNRKALNRDDPGLLQAIGNYCGSWAKAIRALGFEPNDFRVRRQWTKSSAIQGLRNVFSLGQSIEVEALNRRHPGLYPALVKHFGGLYGALAMLKRNPKSLLIYSPPVRKWIMTLSEQEFRRVSEYAISMVRLERQTKRKKVFRPRKKR